MTFSKYQTVQKLLLGAGGAHRYTLSQSTVIPNANFLFHFYEGGVKRETKRHIAIVTSIQKEIHIYIYIYMIPVFSSAM